MPRYYFHVRRGQLTFLENEGIELTDIEEAATEAVRRGGHNREARSSNKWGGASSRIRRHR
jgi:Domain of unknown function (DUF6894)